MAKSGRLELGDNILPTLQLYLQPLWCNWPAKQSNSVKKNAKKGYYVTVRRRRSVAALSYVSADWQQAASTMDQSRTGRTYEIKIIRHRLNFLLGATAEALRVNIDWKSAISLQRGQFDPTFQAEGFAPTCIQCSAVIKPTFCSVGKFVLEVCVTFTVLVKRMSNCDEIQNNILTPNIAMNVLIYGSLRTLMISRLKNSKWPRNANSESLFLMHTVLLDYSAKQLIKLKTPAIVPYFP